MSTFLCPTLSYSGCNERCSLRGALVEPQTVALVVSSSLSVLSPDLQDRLCPSRLINILRTLNSSVS